MELRHAGEFSLGFTAVCSKFWRLRKKKCSFLSNGQKAQIMTYYHFSAPFWDVPRQNKITELSVMSSIGECVLAVNVSSSKVDFTYLLASCAAWGHWLTELMVLPQNSLFCVKTLMEIYFHV